MCLFFYTTKLSSEQKKITVQSYKLLIEYQYWFITPSTVLYMYVS